MENVCLSLRKTDVTTEWYQIVCFDSKESRDKWHTNVVLYVKCKMHFIDNNAKHLWTFLNNKKTFQIVLFNLLLQHIFQEAELYSNLKLSIQTVFTTCLVLNFAISY